MIALAQACLHFSAETAYAAGRATFLKRMMEEHCAGLKERSPAILADTATNRLWACRSRHWEPLRD